jgi:hypothetical protein
MVFGLLAVTVSDLAEHSLTASMPGLAGLAGAGTHNGNADGIRVTGDDLTGFINHGIGNPGVVGSA